MHTNGFHAKHVPGPIPEWPTRMPSDDDPLSAGWRQVHYVLVGSAHGRPEHEYHSNNNGSSENMRGLVERAGKVQESILFSRFLIECMSRGLPEEFANRIARESAKRVSRGEAPLNDEEIDCSLKFYENDRRMHHDSRYDTPAVNSFL